MIHENLPEIKIIGTFHPEPGETDLNGIDEKTGLAIGRYFYENAEIAEIQDFSNQKYTFSIRTPGGFAGLIGSLDGKPAILHKNPDGTRTLNLLKFPEIW